MKLFVYYNFVLNVVKVYRLDQGHNRPFFELKVHFQVVPSTQRYDTFFAEKRMLTQVIPFLWERRDLKKILISSA